MTYYLCFMAIIASVFSDSIFVPDLSTHHYEKKGDFNIGILQSVHQYDNDEFCSTEVRNLDTVQRIEAIAYAIEEVNNRTDILPHHTLGFVMYDDCYKDITALAQALHFIMKDNPGICLADFPVNCTEPSLEFHEVVGFITSESSASVVQVANLFTSFRIPQISYMATVNTLSDKDRYPYFKRMIPSDKQQAKAIIDLLLHFNFTYVSVIYSEGKYGEEGYKMLDEEASKRDVCFGVVQEIRKNSTAFDFRNIVHTVLLETDARTVVVFSHLEDARKILQASKPMQVDGRITWIASDAWARNIKDLAGLEDLAKGILSVNIESANVQRFNQYFCNMGPYDKPDNPWMDEYWQNYVGCTISNESKNVHKCELSARFSDSDSFIPDQTLSLVFDTIYAFAYGLDATAQSRDCSVASTPDKIPCVEAHLNEYLSNISFSGENGTVAFDSKGDVSRSYVIYNFQYYNTHSEFVNVAKWDKGQEQLIFTGQDIQWSLGEVPQSFCSNPCGIGEQQILLQRRCCWVCEKCADHQRTNLWQDRIRCYDCAEGTWPDQETRETCVPITPTYLMWHDTLGIILTAMASAGKDRHSAI